MMNIHADKIIANKFVGEFENNNNNEGFNIGDIKWSSVDITHAGFLIANGASVRRDTYPDLCALYEAMNFPWGSVDEEHFNLPNLIGKFVEGSENAGGYKEAGLPNIEGSWASLKDGGVSNLWSGAINTNGYANNFGGQIAGSFGTVAYRLDASHSNQIYGKSSTVQPPSVLLTPYIKAFRGASASSTDLEITQLANELNTYDCVVESYSDENGNWYRLYKRGWIEQGGILLSDTSSPTSVSTINLLKPMGNTSYTVLTQFFGNSWSGSAPGMQNFIVLKPTPINFLMKCGNSYGEIYKKWYVCGQGV